MAPPAWWIRACACNVGRATNQVVPGARARLALHHPDAFGHPSVRGTRFRVSAGDDARETSTTEVLDGRCRWTIRAAR